MIFILIALVNPAAEEENLVETVFERTFLSFGGTLTLADDFDGLGAGLILARAATFLDGRYMNDFYLMLFLSGPIRLLHPDDVQISDMKLIGIGYRAATPIKNLGFDASLAVTRGSRRIENTVLGDNYPGIAPAIGLYFPHEYFIDFGINLSPVINVLALASDSEVANKTYFDIELLVTIKNFYKKQPYQWHED